MPYNYRSYNACIEIKINAEDISNITSASAVNSQEEERKAHSSMDARPHSNLNVVQACPLEEETEKSPGVFWR